MGRGSRRGRGGNRSDPNYQFLIGVKEIPFRELAQVRITADKVIDSAVPDPTGGATYYYNTCIKAPAWSAKAKQTLKLGEHIFSRTSRDRRSVQGSGRAGADAARRLQFQDWRYGEQLAERARLHADTLNQLTQAAATQ